MTVTTDNATATDEVAIRWVDAPPKLKRGGRWETLLLPLFDRPGQWAAFTMHFRTAASIGGRIRDGRYHTTRGGRWEATFRRVDAMTADLYVRWLPDANGKAS